MGCVATLALVPRAGTKVEIGGVFSVAPNLFKINSTDSPRFAEYARAGSPPEELGYALRSFAPLISIGVIFISEMQASVAKPEQDSPAWRTRRTR